LIKLTLKRSIYIAKLENNGDLLTHWTNLRQLRRLE